MNYMFDGCTEVLLNQIIESSPEGCPEAESLLEQLSEFQKVCIGTGLCPKGELIRGYMCRHFLRDAVPSFGKDPQLENREKQSNILLFHAWGTILGQSERCFGMISILLTI